MVKLILALTFLLLPIAVFAQTDSISVNHTIAADTTNKRDLIDIARSIVHVRSRPIASTEKKKFYFSILPVSTSGATDSKMLITSTTAGVYFGDRSTTYISSFDFAPYFNLKGRYGLPIRSNIWLSNNAYNIQGDSRLLVYPQYTWGLGGGHPSDDKYLVNYKYLRLYQSASKRITPYFFAGIGLNMDYYFDIDSDNGTNTTLSQFSGYKYGTRMDED